MSIKQIKDLPSITLSEQDWVMAQKADDLTTGKVAAKQLLGDGKFLPLDGGEVEGDLAVRGNLTVNGKTTTIESETLKVADKLIEVAKDNTLPLTSPAGIVVPKYDGTNSGALVYDASGTAYVGDAVIDENGNIDVAASDLEPLATRNFVAAEIEKAITVALNTAV